MRTDPNTTVPPAPHLRVLVAAGGTAGHLAPALAVADVLRDAGHDVRFAASSGRRDAELIGARGYEAELFQIGGLPRRPGLAQLRAVFRAATAVFTCVGIVRRARPDVLLAGGGFVSAPAALAARLVGVPVVTTEADAHLGLANRISGRRSRRLLTAYPLPRLRLRQEVVGRPVDQRFFDLAERGPQVARGLARDTLGLPLDARVLAVVGGSGGATRLNDSTHAAWGGEADPRVGATGGAAGEPLWILHVTGRRDHADVVGRGIASDRYRVIEYCDDMPTLLAAADLVVSRPGGSVFELAAMGRAAVLVPSPHVTGNHQARNAQWFADRGGARMVADTELDGPRLRALAEELLAPEGDGLRAGLERGITALARPRAAQRIATVVAQCGGAKVRERGAATSMTPAPTDPTMPLAGRRFHLLGAGGAGVSALAQLCAAWGARVDGCDRADSAYAGLVRAAGIPVAIGHDAAHVEPGVEVVVSSALPSDHPELQRARELSCPVRLRGELLGELTSLRPDTVVVAGAHGKSTTTGMLAHVANRLGLDPAVAAGATIPGLGADGVATNVRTGQGPFLVEGDESDRTLLHLQARIAIVTNIERDHHHTFTSDADVEALFATWIRTHQPELLVAGPGEALDRLVVHATGRVVRFGEDEAELARVAAALCVPGRHNALNASGALHALVALGVEEERALAELGTFGGVGRRFEQVGEANGVLVVDDYGHHPTEVAATIEAARGLARERGGRVLVAFQPHLYSRTQALWSEFADALANADRAWVLPIYGAREEPVEGVSERLIADAVVERAPRTYAGHGVSDPATGDVATIVDEVMEGDVLITMGAGSVTELAPRLLDSIEAVDSTAPAWIERDVPLHKFTTIGTGGPARLFAKVESEERLVEALAFARERGLSIAVVGLGSNTLIDDDGFGGLAIRLAGELGRIEVDAERARVVLGGGASLAASVRLCREAGLSGFEFACAIPGTAGGALKMNAGAYGGEMRDVLLRARLVSASGVREVVPADLDMRYRHTNIPWNEIVSEIEIALGHDEPDAIKARIKEMQGRRSESQPRAARSFGSVFQNPIDAPADASADAFEEGRLLGAGALIERAGLKGHRIGGARISPKHGNFIENDEQGTTADIVALIELARETVRERFGVLLHTEVHLLARDGYRPLHDGLAEEQP
ncbi:MAG: Multifunctional fusion protein [Thermoleophilia bacterium]|nr:Multifunctional fusion protein [Thermoleophilia bacterium]